MFIAPESLNNLGKAQGFFGTQPILFSLGK